MNENEYVKRSLELHLFFDRIMKEHSFFLEVAFPCKEEESRKIARDFQRIFSDNLEQALVLSNQNMSQEFLSAQEIVTSNTLEAEQKTSDLSGIPIRTQLTISALQLQSGNMGWNPQTLQMVQELNRCTLTNIQNLITFKNNVLNQVLSCKMYTTNYPLLITHIMNEAKMYHKLLSKIERKEAFTDEYIYEQELFWNNIMKEHAEFIRGLLDPSEKKLILTADQYADAYELLLQNYGNVPSSLTGVSLQETLSFRDFKIAGEEGILNCKIKSIIIPLLADHVLREANHFIRILRNHNI